MTRRQAYPLAVVVAVAIVSVGTTYAYTRPASYESTAIVALAPRGDIPTEDIPSLVGGFVGSAALGTYVELITSRDTLRAAGSPPVVVRARAVPDTRAINVTAEGQRTLVRPALVSVLRAATLSQQELRDVWELRVLQAAQPPVKAGPTPEMITAGSVVLAIFGAVLLFVILGQLRLLDEPRASPASSGRAPQREGADGAPGGTPRRPRQRKRAR